NLVTSTKHSERQKSRSTNIRGWPLSHWMALHAVDHSFHVVMSSLLPIASSIPLNRRKVKKNAGIRGPDVAE
ncbi:hypothetical protein GCK32_018563, partial [Trichostrongylus colubriformis]